MTNLPTGIVAISGKTKGYRVLKYAGQKTYHVGSFQNLDHAIMVNNNLDTLVADFRLSLKSESSEVAPDVEDIHAMIVENSLSDMTEITRLITAADKVAEYRMAVVSGEVARLHKRLDELTKIAPRAEPQKSVWNRFAVRPKQ